MKKEKNTLGEKLKKCREAYGMSQEQLAKAIGENSAMVISNWEKDKSSPNTKKMLKICETLNAPLNYFYECDGDKLTLDDKELLLILRYRKLQKPYQEIVSDMVKTMEKY